MRTIVAISNPELWANAQRSGEYARSTIDESLEEVGYVHCTDLSQTATIANRYFAEHDDLILLLIDEDKVKPQVKREESPRSGLVYPHIYGPLNVDAVYGIAPLPKDAAGQFVMPAELQA